ncbi:radical SAM protein [uncultured Ruthenibacterium sp.]|uniref:radical SAM protein n=1 Tax=uncultured Ruthenibacterium sp. TaxID=1905347 RepID=UPI00349EAF0F
MEITHCTLCPRACGADRTRTRGLCGGGAQVRLARAALHFWEEPCISGTKGSGTVFFSGCPLQCCYCQNFTISAQNFGKEVSTRTLADIFLRLQEQGAHNINLVTAGHYLPWVLEALALAGPELFIPIVYNTGGYETQESLQMLKDVVDVWLTDIKYVSPVLSKKYSGAADYFDVASAAALTMCRMAGPPVLDAEGLLKKGVIVRHLALPGALADTKAVLKFMAEQLPANGFLTSLMSQYTPFYKAKEYKELSRRISTYEYRQAVNYAVELGLTQGFMQEKSSAKEEYTPSFQLEGVEEVL